MTSRLLVALPFLLFAACHAPKVAMSLPTARVNPPEAGAQSAPDPRPPQAPKVAAKAGGQEAKANSEGDDVAALEKELRKKQRELPQRDTERRIAALTARVKSMAVLAARDKATYDAETATKALEHFLEKQRPRELDEHQIRIDRSTHRAEHAKDEYDELVSMYAEDEFAKSTKELVLKRGRRSLEMAERDLAVAKQEFEEFRGFTLPRRESELQRKVADARRELRKADLETDKASLEQTLAEQKSQAGDEDLNEAIRELQQKIAKAKAATKAGK